MSESIRAVAGNNSGAQGDNFLVAVCPQSTFDVDLTTEGFSRALAQSAPVSLVYLTPPRHVGHTFVDLHDSVRVLHGGLGEIPPNRLQFIKDQSTIDLVGGYCGQSHLTAFESILKTVQNRGLNDVTIRIPYQGVFVSHVWKTDGTGIKVEGPEGRCMHLLEWPLELLQKSYSLEQVGRYRYDTSNTDGFSQPVKILKDGAGQPLLSDRGEQRDSTLFRIYFEQYANRARDISGERKEAVTIAYEPDAILITLNANEARVAQYRECLLNAETFDRYPRLTPDLLRSVVLTRSNQGNFLDGYFHRIAECFTEMPSKEIVSYQEIYAEFQGSSKIHRQLDAAIAQSRLNEAIQNPDSTTASASLSAGAKPSGHATDISKLGNSQEGLRVLDLIIPYLHEDDLQWGWFWAIREGQETIFEKLSPHVDINQWDSSFRQNGLAMAWDKGHDGIFDKLIAMGANPYARDRSGGESLLGTVAVFDTQQRLRELLQRIPFSNNDLDCARDAFRRWNVSGDKSVGKLEILEGFRT